MVYTGGDALFDWDDANVEHIARHGGSPEEVEEVVLSAERVLLAIRRARGESRRTLIGQTDAGRVVVVIYTMRNGLVRVITARPPNTPEVRVFRRHRRRQS